MAYDDIIDAAGRQYNVDPALLRAQMAVESGGNPNALSEKGAQGLMQIIPATQKALGVTNPNDPSQSIYGAAKLMAENLDRYGNVADAVRAYHGGTDQANWGPKTQAYAQKVTAQYGGAPMPAKAAAPAEEDFAAADFAHPSAAKQSAAEEDFAASDFAAPKTAAGQSAAPVTAQASVAGPQGQQLPVEAPAKPTTPFLDRPAGQMAADAAGAYKDWIVNNTIGGIEGLHKVIDAPTEWLAKGFEKTGLTSGLNSLGANLPTYEQQVAMHQQRREEFAKDNTSFASSVGNFGGQAVGTMVPVGGAQMALAKGGNALLGAMRGSTALAGAAPAAEAAGTFLAGGGGLASRVANGAMQGAAGGALLSGGDPNSDIGHSALTGAILGGAIPVAGSVLSYGKNALKSIISPFLPNGQSTLAKNTIFNYGAKDPVVAETGAPPAGGPPPAPPGGPTPPEPPLPPGADPSNPLLRAARGGRITADFTEYVPGSVPTLAQATGNGGIAALERAALSRAPNEFTERRLANSAARNDYFQQIAGTPETLAAAVEQREQQALPMLQTALSTARPANANPVLQTIDGILKTGEGQRPAVSSALNQVRGRIDLGDGKGAQTDVEQLYGIRKSINDQLENVAGRDNSASQQASRQLIQVRDALDDSIQQAAPGFKEFLKSYADMSKPINAQQYLQKLNLTDQTSSEITLNSVKRALLQIKNQRNGPGASDAKAITDDQLLMLNNLHKDLQRNANSSRGMAIGSNTFQNFATNQLIDSMLPGKIGAIAPVGPSGLGGAIGYGLGGPVGAGMGAMVGQHLGSVVGRAMNAQGPEVEAKLINYLLNPVGSDVLSAAARAEPGAANNLLRSAVQPAVTGNPSGPSGKGGKNGK